MNLASKPFNNRALPWIISLAIIAFSILVLIFVASGATQTNRQTKLVQADINTLKQQEQGLVKEAEQVHDSFTPQQLQALRAAHGLADRKRFSWSKLLADLEDALPANARVSRISVRDIVTNGDETVAQLELGVFAKNSTTITDMIASMARAGVFQAELRVQNLQKGRGENGTEYELWVIYRPRNVFTADVATANSSPR
ncbi:MAG: hypothetical protein ABR555_05880 [Pyrinomonadaceae bacterium]